MTSRRESVELEELEEGRERGVSGRFVPVRTDARHTMHENAINEKMVLDPEPTGVQETGGPAWNYIHGRMKEHDKAMIEGHTGDIDSLLIFAGLFSAVLTAFLVETYSQLQIDTGQVTVQILLDISQQLHNVSEGQVALPTNATATINHFAPDPSVVVINCLWFLSLIAALCSALLGIIVKQWLREYSLWTTIAPVEHAVHLRQYRYQAMIRWKVPTIVTFLPTLLQISVIFFFGGLVALLWPINHAVAIAAGIAVGFSITSAMLTILMPLVMEACPYKTPLGWALLASVRPLYSARYSLGQRFQALVSTSRIQNGWRLRFMKILHQWSRKHPDLYDNGSWTQRDLWLPSVGADPVHAVTWKCRSLLWTAAHEELSADIITSLIISLPGPRLRTRAEGESAEDDEALYSWPDNAHKRLHAYWLAICEVIGIAHKGSVPALDAIEVACAYDTTEDGGLDWLSFSWRNVRLPLSGLNATQLHIMFELLASGVQRILKESEVPFPSATAPFTVNNVEHMHVSTLCMLRILSGLRPELQAPFCSLLLKTLLDSSRLRWPDSMDGTAVIISLLLSIDEADWNDCTPTEFVECLRASSPFGETETLGTSQRARDVFWAVIAVVTNLRAHNTSGSTSRIQSATTSFLAMVTHAISEEVRLRDSDPDIGAHRLSVPWIKLIRFAGHHRELAPRALVHQILTAQELGFGDKDMLDHFRHLYCTFDERWAIRDMEALYSFFDYIPLSKRSRPNTPISYSSAEDIEPATPIVESRSHAFVGGFRMLPPLPVPPPRQRPVVGFRGPRPLPSRFASIPHLVHAGMQFGIGGGDVGLAPPAYHPRSVVGPRWPGEYPSYMEFPEPVIPQAAPITEMPRSNGQQCNGYEAPSMTVEDSGVHLEPSPDISHDNLRASVDHPLSEEVLLQRDDREPHAKPAMLQDLLSRLVGAEPLRVSDDGGSFEIPRLPAEPHQEVTNGREGYLGEQSETWRDAMGSRVTFDETVHTTRTHPSREATQRAASR